MPSPSGGARISALVLPTFAAAGGTHFSVEIASVPIYPFKVLVPVLFAAAVLMRRSSLTLYPESSILLVLSFWSLIAVTWALDPADSLQTTSILLFAVMLFMLLRSWGTAIVDDLINGWRLALVVTGLVAVWELASGTHLNTIFVTAHAEAASGLILSLFVNPNDYGAFLALAIPLCLYSRSGRPPAWAIATAVVSFGFLALSASRLALVGLVLAAIAVGWRLRRSWWTVPAAWVGAVALVAGGAALAAIGTNIVEKSAGLLDLDSVGQGSLGIRAALSADGLWAAITTGGLGVGGGGFAEMIKDPMLPVTVRSDVFDPHNFWVETTAELGVIGLALILGLIGVMTRRILAQRPRQEPQTTIILGSLVAYFFASTTSSAFLSAPVNWMFLATVSALSFSLRNRAMSPEPAIPDRILGAVDSTLAIPNLHDSALRLRTAPSIRPTSPAPGPADSGPTTPLDGPGATHSRRAR